MEITKIGKMIERYTIENSPAILTTIAVTGTVSTAILASRASIKAMDILRAPETEEELTTSQKVKLVWPLYIPATAMCGMTITSIVLANRIGSRRAAAIAAAYSLSEKAFDEYREKVAEKFGEKKAQNISDEIAQDRVDSQPAGRTEVIVTGAGNVLCYDMYTGRYFTSDMESLKKAQNDLNYHILNNFYASLNDFYNLIGLATTKTGDDLGWNSDRIMELTFSTTMSDDQRPCIAIDFDVQPSPNYFRTK